WHDFLLVPDMIARRQDIYAPIEKLIGNLRCYAKPRSRVLAIQNGETYLILFLQMFQVLMNYGPAGLSDRIPDKKYFHGESVGSMDGLSPARRAEPAQNPGRAQPSIK